MRYHLPDGHALTPDEIQCLRLVAARAQMDRGDLSPMLRITPLPDGFTEARVLPWLVALNLEVS